MSPPESVRRGKPDPISGSEGLNMGVGLARFGDLFLCIFPLSSEIRRGQTLGF